MTPKASLEPLEERALRIAASAHQHQTDLRGRPYLKHLLEVAAAVRAYGPDAITLALLHDTLEDAPDTNLEGIPEHIMVALRAITRAEGEAYEAYIERVATNPLATTIKLADLRLNLATCPKVSLARRYETAIARLERTGTPQASAKASAAWTDPEDRTPPSGPLHEALARLAAHQDARERLQTWESRPHDRATYDAGTHTAWTAAREALAALGAPPALDPEVRHAQ